MRYYWRDHGGHNADENGATIGTHAIYYRSGVPSPLMASLLDSLQQHIRRSRVEEFDDTEAILRLLAEAVIHEAADDLSRPV